MINDIITVENPKSRSAEAYRTLRTNIQFSSIDGDNLKTILVTSSGPGEGKSTVAINLAITIAQSGKKVLLLDCDFRKPSIHKKLGLPNREGLTNILIKDKDMEECILSTSTSNLFVLTSGAIPPNPSELLGTKKMKDIITNLKEFFDIIIIDSPPVIAVTDAQILSTVVNGVIMVAAYGKAEKVALMKSKELIYKVGGKLLGVVLNKVPTDSQEYYYGNYYNEYESN